MTVAVKRCSNSRGSAAVDAVDVAGRGDRALLVADDVAGHAVLEDLRHRTAGVCDYRVPHASASIITRPNGSGQSIGKRRARALPMNSFLSRSSISPSYCTSECLRSGSNWVSK
jgi:hypothetical protein